MQKSCPERAVFYGYESVGIQGTLCPGESMCKNQVLGLTIFGYKVLLFLIVGLVFSITIGVSASEVIGGFSSPIYGTAIAMLIAFASIGLFAISATCACLVKNAMNTDLYANKLYHRHLNSLDP